MSRASKTGLRKAIGDMCKQCIYNPRSGGGTWREQTEACPARNCPLWPVRPISGRARLADLAARHATDAA